MQVLRPTQVTGRILALMDKHTGKSRFVGINVMPEYLQTEGDGFIDRLIGRTGATAIGITPCVVEQADQATGDREPPLKYALLDRPLWGRRELFIRVAPSFDFDPSLYEGVRYRPPEPTALTARNGHLVANFIDAAKSRGLEAHIRVQSAAPPGFRAAISNLDADDEPRLPNGDTLPNRLDQSGSLASPHVKAYICALLRDLCAHYPNADGFHLDWAEYPPYTLDSVFFDFCGHAEVAADRFGFDFDRMRADAAAVRGKFLGGLENSELRMWLTPNGGRDAWRGLLTAHPGLADLFRFKALLSEELLEACRDAVTDAAGPDMKVAPMAFPPPWTAVSGFDYGRAAKHCDSILLKLIPSHWPMMLRAYGEAIHQANPRLSETLLVEVLNRILDIGDAEADATLESYSHPADGEAFAVGREAQLRKIEQGQAQAGKVPVFALVHSGGAVDDFRERLALAYAATGNKVWINRYGFLSDAKLDAIGEVTAP